MPHSHRYTEIPWGSPHYLQALLLREQRLRKPIGLSLTNEDLSAEIDMLHFACLESTANSERLIAYLLASPTSSQTVQLRQVVVAKHRERQGIGRQLMKHCEQNLKTRGYISAKLYARLPQIGFYKALGYCPIGPIFKEVGIDHQKMEKRLHQVNH